MEWLFFVLGLIAAVVHIAWMRDISANIKRIAEANEHARLSADRCAVALENVEVHARNGMFR